MREVCLGLQVAHEAGHEERVGSHRLSAPDVGLLLSVARGVSRRTRRHGRRHPLGGVVEAVCESQVLTKYNERSVS
jgi:hypothetical protein